MCDPSAQLELLHRVGALGEFLGPKLPSLYASLFAASALGEFLGPIEQRADRRAAGGAFSLGSEPAAETLRRLRPPPPPFRHLRDTSTIEALGNLGEILGRFGDLQSLAHSALGALGDLGGHAAAGAGCRMQALWLLARVLDGAARRVRGAGAAAGVAASSTAEAEAVAEEAQEEAAEGGDDGGSRAAAGGFSANSADFAEEDADAYDSDVDLDAQIDDTTTTATTTAATTSGEIEADAARSVAPAVLMVIEEIVSPTPRSESGGARSDSVEAQHRALFEARLKLEARSRRDLAPDLAL